MKSKIIGGVFALVAVSTIAIAFSSSFRQRELRPVQRMQSVSLDAAPQNKFGFAEAMSPAVSMPWQRQAEPAAAAQAANAAAAAASDAARAASEIDSPGITPTAIAPGLPRIAYTYSYGYRIEAGQIAALQRAHADYCEKQGPRVCRIVALEQSGEEGDGYAEARLELAVATERARSFGAELSKSVTAAGGKEITTAIAGEDLSKQMVDTEARLRARTLLRDRLMEVLASRKGTVAELVEAERGVAQVNEEIDEARSWLTEMQGRVEFSRMTIHYGSNAASLAQSQSGGFLGPIRAVLGSVGAILGTIIAMLIALITTLLPIGLAGWGLHRLWRKYRPASIKSEETEGRYAG